MTGLLQGRKPATLVLLVSILMQVAMLGFAFARHGSIAGFAFASVDSGEYFRIACNLLDHGQFSQSERPPLMPDTWRTPTYPLFMAGVFAVLGRSAAGTIIIQCILTIANAIIFYVICRRMMRPGLALWAGLLFAVEPFHVYYSVWLLATTLFTTILLLCFSTWQELRLAPTYSRATCLGLGLGALVLTRPLAVLIPPVVWIAMPFVLHSRRRAWRCAAVCTVAGMALIGPWLIRNKAATGNLKLSHQYGVVQAYYKATEAVLYQQGKAGDRYDNDVVQSIWHEIDAELRERLWREHPEWPANAIQALNWSDLAWGRTPEVAPFVVSSALWRIGNRRLLEHPLVSAKCYVLNSVQMFSFPLGLGLFPPANRAAAPFGNLLGTTRPLLSQAAAVLLGAGYLTLLVVALARVVGGWNRMSAMRVAELALPLICLWLTTTPQIDPRFRVPMIPFLLMLAFRSKRD